jgi:uncharacterized protein
MTEATPDAARRTQIEAQAFRRLLEHLRSHPEVQNLDLMNLAGFCRNCLSKWYRAAAAEQGVELDYEQAREDRLRYAVRGIQAAPPAGGHARAARAFCRSGEQGGAVTSGGRA